MVLLFLVLVKEFLIHEFYFHLEFVLGLERLSRLTIICGNLLLILKAKVNIDWPKVIRVLQFVGEFFVMLLGLF